MIQCSQYLFQITLSTLVLSTPLYAESGIVWFQVSDPEDKPIVGVQLSSRGPGALSRPTDVAGKAHISLPPGIGPGDWLSLQIVTPAREWAFISPWDARVLVPKFREGGQDFVPIILGKRGSRELIANPKALRVLAEVVLEQSKIRLGLEALPVEERRRKAVEEVAQHFGLQPADVDEAIREKLTAVKDPYDEGLAALYAGRYSDASKLFAQSLSIRKERIEKEELGVVDAARFLAQSRIEDGKFLEASEAYKEGLALSKNDVPLLLDYATSLRLAGNYQEAEPALRKALALAELTLGPEHYESLRAKNNLAVLLQEQGEISAALILQKELVTASERILGVDHQDTLVAKNVLGDILRKQGDFHAARQVQEEILKARRRVLGPDHPKVLLSKNNLAVTLRDLGDLSGARKLQEEVLAFREKTLPPDHRDLLRSKNNLASTLRDLGLVSAALKLDEEVVEGRTKTLGANHPETLTSKNNLALTLRALGRLAEARSLQEETVPALELRIGQDNPITLRARNNLAVTLRYAGQLADSRSMAEKVVAHQERVLGLHHPDTVQSTWDLLLTLFCIGDLVATCGTCEKLRWLLEAKPVVLGRTGGMIREKLPIICTCDACFSSPLRLGAEPNASFEDRQLGISSAKATELQWLCPSIESGLTDN